MKCDICGEHDALIHIQQIMNGETRELHLCAKCAGNRGLLEEGPGGEHAGLTKLLGNIVGSLFSETEGEAEERSVCCGFCGASREEIEETGKAGCAECYTTFPSLMRRIMGKEETSEPYKGKIPARLRAYKACLVDKAVLRKKLEEALAEEDYEKAASIRDAIAGLDGDGRAAE